MFCATVVRTYRNTSAARTVVALKEDVSPRLVASRNPRGDCGNNWPRCRRCKNYGSSEGRREVTLGGQRSSGEPRFGSKVGPWRKPKATRVQAWLKPAPVWLSPLRHNV